MAAATIVRAVGGNLAQNLKEIRIHLCQHSAASQGVRPTYLRTSVVGKDRRVCTSSRVPYRRDFIEQHYVTLKKTNPNFPILIRECSNVHPMLWVRYAFGLEKSVSLNNLNVDQIAKALENAINSKI